MLGKILIHFLVGINYRTLSCKAKVTKLSAAIIVNQNVGWLNVSVHDVGGVQVIQRAQKIVHDDGDVLCSEAQAVVLVEDLAQITFLVIHYYEYVIYLIFILRINLRCN